MKESDMGKIASDFEHASSPRGRSSTQVADYLKAMIISGELKAGERINESTMSTTLAVSRTPLREAIKILQAEGLVEIKPNRGAWIKEQSIQDVSDTIALIVGLERMSAEAACEKTSDSDISELEAMQTQMVQAFNEKDLMNYFKLNQKIHQKIIDCAGNRVLSRVYRMESLKVQRFRYVGNEIPNRWAEAIEEHEQILTALKNREVGLLRELFKSHHLRGWRSAREVLTNKYTAENGNLSPKN